MIVEKINKFYWISTILQLSRYPFNWKTSLGYLACIIIQALTIYVASGVFTARWIISIGYCEFSNALILDLKKDLQEIRRMLSELRKMSRPKRKLAQIEIAKKLVEFVNFHSVEYYNFNGRRFSRRSETVYIF